MKSPLSFLTQLISRRQPAELRQALIEQQAEAEAAPLENKDEAGAGEPAAAPVESPAVYPADVGADAPAFLAEKLGSDDAAEPAETAMPRAATLAETVDDAATETVSPPVKAPAAVSTDRLPAKARTRRTTRLKSSTTLAPPSEDVATVDTADSLAAAPVTTFADEATGLDAEISALRAQLAQKLRLQNAQLKKMLERFERF